MLLAWRPLLSRDAGVHLFDVRLCWFDAAPCTGGIPANSSSNPETSNVPGHCWETMSRRVSTAAARPTSGTSARAPPGRLPARAQVVQCLKEARAKPMVAAVKTNSDRHCDGKKKKSEETVKKAVPSVSSIDSM